MSRVLERCIEETVGRKAGMGFWSKSRSGWSSVDRVWGGRRGMRQGGIPSER